MKKPFLLLFLVFCITKVFSQDIIYLADGGKVAGKVSEITADSVKFKVSENPNEPLHFQPIKNVKIAFNSAGDYLVLAQAKPLTEKEKQEFISGQAKQRPFDILIDADGKILPVNITDENETEITTYENDQKVKLSKSNFVLAIRKNGTHELFLSAELSLPYLLFDKAKINYLISQPVSKSPVIANEASVAVIMPKTKAHDNGSSESLEPDMRQFSTKAIQKTKDFTAYLETIASVNTRRDAAVKCINLAFDLFVGESAKVEVSNTHSTIKSKYKILDYLTRLMIKSGQYDKVKIEYANVNYATKFTQGVDGNYYGSVTFVQKFQGFIDGKIVYGDQTKRSIIIVLKHYKKEVNGETLSGWDVFLGDIGVVETQKL